MLKLKPMMLQDETVEEIDALVKTKEYSKIVNTIRTYESLKLELKDMADWYYEKADQADKLVNYAKVWMRNMIGSETIFLDDVKAVPQDYISRAVDPTLLSDEEKKYAVTMDFDLYTAFNRWIETHHPDEIWTLETVCPTVSKLPEKHPAIYNKSEVKSIQIKKLSLKDLKDANSRQKRLENNHQIDAGEQDS
jgi:hypothetical protein